MILTTFLLIAGLAALSLFVAIFQNKPSYAIAGGTILLILSMFTLSTGIQVQTGVSINQTQIDSNTTQIDKEYQYTSLEDDIGINNTRNFMFLLTFALGLALMYNGLTGRTQG